MTTRKNDLASKKFSMNLTDSQAKDEKTNLDNKNSSSNQVKDQKIENKSIDISSKSENKQGISKEKTKDGNVEIKSETLGKNKFTMEYNKEDDKNREQLEKQKKQIKDLETANEDLENRISEINMDIDEKKQSLSKTEIKLKEKQAVNKEINATITEKQSQLLREKERAALLMEEYNRIKRVEKLKEMEKDLETIQSENLQLKKLLDLKKEEILTDKNVSQDTMEKFKKAFTEHQILAQKKSEIENKSRKNLGIIKGFQNKSNGLKETLVSTENDSKEKDTIASFLMSISEEIKGSPAEIIQKVNRDLLKPNKENKLFRKRFDSVPINNMTKSLKMRTSRYIQSPSRTKFAESYDVTSLEKELFNKDKSVKTLDKNATESPNRLLTSFNEDIENKKYEDMCDEDLILLGKKKEFLIRENEKCEQHIKRSSEEFEKMVGEMRFSLDHNQRRLFMLKEQNDYLGREIADLTRLIGFRFTDERFKKEIKNIELIYDKNPVEAENRMQILQELYNNINKQGIIQ